MRLMEFDCECPRKEDNPERTVCTPLPLLADMSDFFDLSDKKEAEFHDKYRSTIPDFYERNSQFQASLPVMDVPLKNVYGIEPCLDPRGARSEGTPLAIQLNGKYLIVDGNHRVASAVNAGKQTLQMRVIQE